jgi:glutamate carboxypeptidase
MIFNGQMNTIDAIKTYQDGMIGFLKELVCLESPTQTKAAVDKCSARLVGELKKLGAAVTRYPQKKRGDLFAADFPGPETFAPLMVLLHIDTVWPVRTLEKMPFSIQENHIYGPGVLDMKAGSVMTVFALKYLRDNHLKPSRPIRVFINSSEEMPWKEADILITGLAEQAGPVLCLEPALPGGGIKYQRKGRMTLRVSARGKSAHAANPEKGHNAIELLMDTLSKVKNLRGDGVTVNIGRIRGGGKLNIVPERATAGLEIRYWTMEKAQAVKKALQGMEKTEAEKKVKISLLTQTPPMEHSEAGDHLFHQTKKIASKLGLRLARGKSGGGSDASVASAAGAAVLDGLGPEGEGMHADHEHLIISSWLERTALLAELFQNL